MAAIDHSKVGSTDFARICELDEIDTLVIDKTTPELQGLCARHDIELVLAPVDPVTAGSGRRPSASGEAEGSAAGGAGHAPPMEKAVSEFPGDVSGAKAR